MSDISSWFHNMPQFTKLWFCLSVAFPLLVRFGLLNGYHLLLLYKETVYKFQLWRPITAVFFYPLSSGSGFHYLMNLYFLYNYSYRLETGTFSRRPADYLFLLIFNWISLVIIGLFANLMLLMDPMVLSVLYIWCQLNKDVVVTFWFGTQFKAMYLPWVLFGFNMILSGGGVSELIGILVGHLYYFLTIKYREDFGRPLLETPKFLENYFPPQVGNRTSGGFQAGFQQPEPRRPPPPTARGGRHSWGQGHVLGNQ